MKEYHKIQTVYLRDPATRHRTLLEGRYATREFEYLRGCSWTFTEKVDGTNVRVGWDGAAVALGGKTDNAQMPVALMARLGELFTADKLAACFTDDVTDVVLYGEGYGAKIQKGGGNYNPDGVDFVLFDVAVSGLFLERHNVEDVADNLGVQVVPVVGFGSLSSAVERVRAGFESAWGPFPAEGLVMRPFVEMCDRLGRRVITKVKAKDFR